MTFAKVELSLVCFVSKRMLMRRIHEPTHPLLKSYVEAPETRVWNVEPRPRCSSAPKVHPPPPPPRHPVYPIMSEGEQVGGAEEEE